MAFKINDLIDIDVEFNGVNKKFYLNYKTKNALEVMQAFLSDMKKAQELIDISKQSEIILESSKKLINTLLDDNAFEQIFEGRLNTLADLQAFTMFLFNEIKKDKEKTLKDYEV